MPSPEEGVGLRKTEMSLTLYSYLALSGPGR